jgi:hypothetical protein
VARQPAWSSVCRLALRAAGTGHVDVQGGDEAAGDGAGGLDDGLGGAGVVPVASAHVHGAAGAAGVGAPVEVDALGGRAIAHLNMLQARQPTGQAFLLEEHTGVVGDTRAAVVFGELQEGQRLLGRQRC